MIRTLAAATLLSLAAAVAQAAPVDVASDEDLPAAALTGDIPWAWTPAAPDPDAPGARRWREALRDIGRRETPRLPPTSRAPRLIPLWLALAGLALWALAPRLKRPRARRALDLGLAGLGLAGVVSFFGLALREGAPRTHLWDTFHYFVAPRYFEELRYDGLYECLVVADAQTVWRPPDVLARRLTDLRTNRVVGTKEILADPGRCTDRFTPARWAAFTAEVSWFRDRMGARTWEKMQLDHGFNATPAWLLAGMAVTAVGPPSEALLLGLNALDPALLLLGLGAMGWAFGWRTAALGALLLGTNLAAPAAWTGGSVLRWDWLFWLLLGASLLKKGHARSGGAALGLAALLRVFPALALAGVALRWLLRRDPIAARALQGAALAAAVVVPAGAAVAGAEAWPACAANLAKHVSMPSNNRVGLRTLVAWERPAGRPRSAWSAWAASHPDRFDLRRFALGLLAGAATALVALAASRVKAWEAPLLGLLLVPVLTEPACYYTMFVVALGPLATRRPSVGPALLALTAATALATLPGWPMGTTAAAWSWAFLLAFAWIAWRAWRPRGDDLSPTRGGAGQGRQPVG